MRPSRVSIDALSDRRAAAVSRLVAAPKPRALSSGSDAPPRSPVVIGAVVNLMRLIGTLDSPYVRRVAISLKFMGIPFSHEPVSVFRQYDTFSLINPVVRAPTLVTDEGIMLMDSTLILDYLQRLIPTTQQLMPVRLDEYVRSLRQIALALVACDKSIQIFHELKQRPRQKQHQPWIDRVCGQLKTAYRLLEAELGSGQVWLYGSRPLQADITIAVSWRFTHSLFPNFTEIVDYPALSTLSQRAEVLPEFLAFPPD